MRIVDCSSYVCSSDLQTDASQYYITEVEHEGVQTLDASPSSDEPPYRARFTALPRWSDQANQANPVQFRPQRVTPAPRRSEEHTSELQSLMRISYAVFCLKKKKHTVHPQQKNT